MLFFGIPMRESLSGKFVKIGLLDIIIIPFVFGHSQGSELTVGAFFSLIFVSIGNAVSPYVSQNLGAKKIERIKKGYRAALAYQVSGDYMKWLVDFSYRHDIV